MTDNPFADFLDTLDYSGLNNVDDEYSEIDDEIFVLYGISSEDRAAIELSANGAASNVDERTVDGEDEIDESEE